jgi:hypothetical protein
MRSPDGAFVRLWRTEKRNPGIVDTGAPHCARPVKLVLDGTSSMRATKVAGQPQIKESI